MMMNTQAFFSLTLAILFFEGSAHAANIRLTNKCPYVVWPGTLTNPGAQLSTTGFMLERDASRYVETPSPWSGRFWGRTDCTTDVSGKFKCATADCDSGQVLCNGKGGFVPATLVEMTIAAAGSGAQDFYDVSLVDGFNLPISVTPLNGNGGECKTSTCAADVNAQCLNELRVIGSGGRVIACKSACAAFQRPEYCCTGAYSKPETCLASRYSRPFKEQCPQAYSYAYNDGSSTFTCLSPPDYVITFCP